MSCRQSTVVVSEIVETHSETFALRLSIYRRYGWPLAGTREGVVEGIAHSTDEHPHPPKVIFTTQRGKDVAHNPSTLTKERDAGESAGGD